MQLAHKEDCFLQRGNGWVSIITCDGDTLIECKEPVSVSHMWAMFDVLNRGYRIGHDAGVATQESGS